MGSAPKLLPTGEGDLVLVGVIEQDDHVKSDARLLLMFRDGVRSPELKTNGIGEFEFRLPPGDWWFAGPLILGEESRSVHVVFKPAIQKPEFHVNLGVPTRKLHMRIVVE